MTTLNRWGLLALALAALAALPAHAQTLALDRDAVLRLARERAPQVLAARAHLDQAAGALGTARAWAHNPELELEFTRRESYRDRGWRVSQQLDLAGRGPRIGAARSNLRAAEAWADDAAARAAAEAARAWLAAVHAGAQRALADEGAAVQERLRAIAAARHLAGDTGALDEALATVALARARAAQATARAEELAARAQLAASLPWESDDLPRVQGALEWPAPPALPVARAAARTHPALAALEAATRAATARRAEAGALAWPQAGIFAGGGREEHADLTQWGVSFSLPIFARGHGERQLADAATRLAQADLVAARAARLAQLTSAWQRHHELQSALAADADDVALALDASVRLAEAAYGLGELPLDEALRAQREQLEARRDLNDLRLSAALAALDVAYLAALPPLHEGDRP
ncbi:MAG: TolC family protein [bacterium]|nr:TolC family protein [bacterium]